MSKENILEHQNLFSPAQNEAYSLGFTRSDIWIRFAVERCEALNEPWVIDIAYPHLDSYTLYIEENGLLKEIASGGDKKIAPEYIYRSRTFWLPVPDVERGVYYLHVNSEGSLQIPVTIKKLSYAYAQENISMLFYGLYYGILFLLLIYNVVLFIVVKEVHYLNYLLFLGTYMLWQLSFDGIGSQWFWSGSVWMANSGMSFFIFLASLMACRFAKDFLHIDRYAPGLRGVFFVTEFTLVAGMALVFVLDYHESIKFAAVMAALVPLLLIYAGVVVLPLYRPARFYLIGWSFFLAATIVTALDKLGLIDSHRMIWSIQQVGSLLEMLFLSFALADRINLLKKRHIGTLQDEIGRRVEEIREKDRLMIHQSRQAAMGEMIENIAHQWRQPLHQLSLVQQNIFIEYALKKLDDKKMQRYQSQSDQILTFMSETIDDFRNFFQPSRVHEPFFVCESISKVTAMASGMLEKDRIAIEFVCDKKCRAVGYANEFSQVVMNLINNAKEALLEKRMHDRRITIELESRSDEITVVVCDNAGGIDEAVMEKIFDPYFTTKFKSQGTGIGLYMSKMIIEKSMQGCLEVANERGGACFRIVLPNKVK